MEMTRAELQSSYDRVAEDYAAQFCGELDKKPFDRKMLDLLVEKVEDSGVICDLGCGPGQVARYLRGRGTKVCGVDLSPEMVRLARRLNPDVPFRQGDMLALTDVRDDSFAGIAAFYSVIHVPRPSLVKALREMRRALRPGGALLLTFHVGDETVHLGEWWGKKVSLDFYFYRTEEMKNRLETAAFKLREVIEREPYPGVEYQSRRAYIFAEKLSVGGAL